MTSTKEIQQEYEEFKRRRDLEKFHHPKNIAMSITIEASELMEHFRWKDNVSLENIKKDYYLRESNKRCSTNVTT